MSYRNRKWMVSFQDDGMLKAVNGWYYICDSDGGINLGYLKNKDVATEIVKRLNEDETKETEFKMREFASNIIRNTPFGYRTEEEAKITEILVDRLVRRIWTEPIDFKFHRD
jgi:hypothetical protein